MCKLLPLNKTCFCRFTLNCQKFHWEVSLVKNGHVLKSSILYCTVSIVKFLRKITKLMEIYPLEMKFILFRYLQTHIYKYSSVALIPQLVRYHNDCTVAVLQKSFPFKPPFILIFLQL